MALYTFIDSISIGDIPYLYARFYMVFYVSKASKYPAFKDSEMLLHKKDCLMHTMKCIHETLSLGWVSWRNTTCKWTVNDEQCYFRYGGQGIAFCGDIRIETKLQWEETACGQSKEVILQAEEVRGGNVCLHAFGFGCGTINVPQFHKRGGEERCPLEESGRYPITSGLQPLVETLNFI